jgi:aryl-alcohol dehydrogenase-like predicted oxidoreductase
MTTSATSVVPSGTVTLGGDLTIHRLGYGTMQLPGPGVWGEPRDRSAAIAVLRRAVELGIDLFDTADSYGAVRRRGSAARGALPLRGHHDRDQGRAYPHRPG